MDNLLDQLLDQWKKAFDGIDQVPKFRTAATAVKYAGTDRFDLKGYNKGHFVSGGILLESPPAGASNFFEYGFKDDHLPCYSALNSHTGVPGWEGYFTYGESEATYIEFCNENKVPSIFQRTLFENGRKSIFQSISINSRGSYPVFDSMSKDDIIDHIIKNEKNSVFAVSEQYEYEGDRIVSALCFASAAGIGRYDYREVYTYDASGNLDSIQTIFNDGHRELSYVRPEPGMDIQQLSALVSGKMAEAIVDTLLQKKVEQPLAILELSYQEIYNYLPSLNTKSARERADIVKQFQGDDLSMELFSSFPSTLMATEKEKIERPLQQLLQAAKETDDYGIATQMLYEACALLTQHKLWGKLSTTEDFIAYAVDWSMGNGEGEFERILKSCGLSDELVREWKDKKWID